MSRKTSIQLQNQQSKSNNLSYFNDDSKYENVKSKLDTNARQLRHQNSFTGVSYLDVIKERERSDSGFSAEAYEEFGEETPILLDNVSECDDLSRNYDNREEVGLDQQTESMTNLIKTPPTSSYLDFSSIRNVDSRRESYDSGLSVSPTAQTPPQFHIELEATDFKNGCQITHYNENGDNARVEAQDDTTPPPVRRRKKKKRLCGSLSVTQFCDVYRLTGEVLGEGSYGKVEECANIFTNAKFAVKIISKSNVHFSRPKVR